MVINNKNGFQSQIYTFFSTNTKIFLKKRVQLIFFFISATAPQGSGQSQEHQCESWHRQSVEAGVAR